MEADITEGDAMVEDIMVGAITAAVIMVAGTTVAAIMAEDITEVGITDVVDTMAIIRTDAISGTVSGTITA